MQTSVGGGGAILLQDAKRMKGFLGETDLQLFCILQSWLELWNAAVSAS